MASLNVKTEYSEYKDCKLRVGKYVEDNSVAVEIYNRWDGPIARVTTYLCDHSLAEDEAYVDTNNCPWAVALLEENGFAERTGRTRRSGYCEYPAMKFDRSKMAEFDPSTFWPRSRMTGPRAWCSASPWSSTPFCPCWLPC